MCRLADGLLVLLMVAAAFLLGCQELSDADVWWHVRSGQWIWSHRSVPVLDPFTFASANRPWIDLHWLFQLMLAGSYALGRVPGMILLASAAWASLILVGMTSRKAQWPMWMIVPCWLPALVVLSDRFGPRPELLSLLAMAVYLTVLRRADRSPALAWVLPLVQVFWVNAHALFHSGADHSGGLSHRPFRAADRAIAVSVWRRGDGALVVDSHLRCNLGRRPGLPGQPLRPAWGPVSTRALAQSYIEQRYL